ncbi:MAG: cytochrome c biogenesis protein CcsA [Deltaproteobacteria bacterium]|nr:cytochrome c biogenesis protein CcsA [Deltaproteobacteria bacterium]
MKLFLLLAFFLYGLGFLTLLASHLFRSDWRGRLQTASTAVIVAGLVAHTAGLVERIAATGHAPMASMYETLAFYSWMTALATLFVVWRYRERSAPLVTVPIAAAAVAFAITKEKPGAPLTLILDTRWFETHVTSSFAAYALFTLAFAGSVLYLISALRGGDESELRKYQDIAGRSVLWGFFFFSASMFAGAIWGYLAWGMYWMWEPKVIWSFIVWFFYAGAMHAYFVKEWRGTGLSVATIIGFAVVGFTYLGVSMLMKSSHSF